LGRYGALAEAEDLLQFGYGDFLDRKQEQNPKPVRVGQQTQRFQN
jgi:hypothetical protein